jgi:hypothetical protein
MSEIRSFRVDKGSHTNAKLWGASTWAKIRAKRASPRVSVPATGGSANSVLLGVQLKVRSFAATTSQIDRVFK